MDFLLYNTISHIENFGPFSPVEILVGAQVPFTLPLVTGLYSAAVRVLQKPSTALITLVWLYSQKTYLNIQANYIILAVNIMWRTQNEMY